MRVFLQMYMDCLEKKCVLMIEGFLFEYLLVLLEVLETLLGGLMWGLLISNFGSFFGRIFLLR